MNPLTRSEDPDLGPAVSKYPPSSGYSNGNARNHTFGHMHREQMHSSATPEEINGLYPSGFPRQSVTPRKTSRTADRMLWRFKQDPDVEVRPVVPGTLVRVITLIPADDCVVSDCALLFRRKGRRDVELLGTYTECIPAPVAQRAVGTACNYQYCTLQTDAEARVRAEQGPLFKPKTPEYEYEIGSRHRKAENQALSKIIQKRQETAEIPHYDEAGQQVQNKSQQLACSHSGCRHANDTTTCI